MIRLSPVLYIRSTLASSRATEASRTAGNPTNGKAEEPQAAQDGTVEKPELPMPAGVSESQAIALSSSVAAEVPSTPHRARRESASLFASQSVDGPFRSAQPSGDTPTHASDGPFEDADTERITVGFVPVRIPRLTDPIAPCMGFAMQAEVVRGPSKFREFRKAQRKVLPERESRIEEIEGGLFFASRIRGRSPPPLNASKEHPLDGPPLSQPVFDYLKVDIPSVSILVPGSEGSL